MKLVHTLGSTIDFRTDDTSTGEVHRVGPGTTELEDRVAAYALTTYHDKVFDGPHPDDVPEADGGPEVDGDDDAEPGTNNSDKPMPESTPESTPYFCSQCEGMHYSGSGIGQAHREFESEPK